MKNWKILDFDTSCAIQPHFKFEDIEQQDYFKLQVGSKDFAAYWVLNRLHLDKFLNSLWIERFESRYHQIKYCYIFYRSKNFVTDDSCHIDIDPDNNEKVLYALNWCYGIDDAYMSWYNDFQIYPDIIEQKNSKYIQDKNYNQIELEKKIIGSNLTLVHTAVPHCVKSNTKERWSISLRLKKIDSVKTWNDAMSYFT